MDISSLFDSDALLKEIFHLTPFGLILVWQLQSFWKKLDHRIEKIEESNQSMLLKMAAHDPTELKLKLDAHDTEIRSLWEDIRKLHRRRHSDSTIL